MLTTRILFKTCCKHCDHSRTAPNPAKSNPSWYGGYAYVSCAKKYEEREDLEDNQRWRDAEALLYEIMPWNNRKYNKEFKVPHGCPFILEVVLKGDENAS